MRHVRKGLIALLAGVLIQASGSVAQPFPTGLAVEEFDWALQERVVTIIVTAKRNKDGIRVYAYGNGTIVSPAGMIVTAKHVIDAFNDGEHQPSTYKVVRLTADGEREYPLRIVAAHKSQYDAVAVPIENAGNLRLPYVCVRRDHEKMPIGAPLAMRSYVYWDKDPFDQPASLWRLNARPDQVKVKDKQGFGESSNYWAATTEFAPSESGAGILSDGRLVGIVANSLVLEKGLQQVPIPGHNYFVPISLVYYDLRLYSLDVDCGEDPKVASAVATVQQDAAATRIEPAVRRLDPTAEKPGEQPAIENPALSPVPVDKSGVDHAGVGEPLHEELVLDDGSGNDPNENTYAWPPGSSLLVCFYGGEPLARIIFAEAAADWTRGANISFDFGPSPLVGDCGPGPGNGDVKVSFEADAGNRATIGRVARLMTGERGTVNLAALSKEKIDAIAADQTGELYTRARASALHEIGHVLGLLHTQLAAGGPCVETFDRDRMIKDGVERESRLPNWFGWPPYQRFDQSSIMMFPYPEEWFLDTARVDCSVENMLISEGDREAILTAYGPAAGGTAPAR